VFAEIYFAPVVRDAVSLRKFERNRFGLVVAIKNAHHHRVRKVDAAHLHGNVIEGRSNSGRRNKFAQHSEGSGWNLGKVVASEDRTTRRISCRGMEVHFIFREAAGKHHSIGIVPPEPSVLPIAMQGLPRIF